MSVLDQTTRPIQTGRGAGVFVLAGTVLGLAWGCSFRGWMSIFAIQQGAVPHYSWEGTFGAVILPAGIIGGVLGWAEYARRTGGRRYWRYTALAPFLFIGFAIIYTPNFFQILSNTAEGSGALWTVAVGLAGGYAFSGRGPLWARIAAGISSAGTVAVFAVGTAIRDGMQPREVFAGLTFALLMIVWIAACSIPHRKAKSARIPI